MNTENEKKKSTSKSECQSSDSPAPAHDVAGRKIWCMYSCLVDIEDLKKNPRNPNKHPDVQIFLLQKILKEQGWRMPIIVSNQSGFIVSGHGRLEAAIRNGYTKVPVNFQDFESPEMEMIHLLADNKIHELSHMDRGEVKDILSDLDTGAIDMDLSGFTNKELEDMMTAIKQDEEPIEEEGSGGCSVSVERCRHCGKEL